MDEADVVQAYCEVITCFFVDAHERAIQDTAALLNAFGVPAEQHGLPAPIGHGSERWWYESAAIVKELRVLTEGVAQAADLVKRLDQLDRMRGDSWERSPIGQYITFGGAAPAQALHTMAQTAQLQGAAGEEHGYLNAHNLRFLLHALRAWVQPGSPLAAPFTA